MENRYILPLEAITESMKHHPNVVMLQSSLSSLPGIWKEACLARLILGQGKLSSCTITAKGGTVLLQQQAALNALARCGDLTWDVVDVVPTPPVNARMNQSDIPMLRVTPLPPSIMATLSHPYIRVLLLVDGQRTIEEIARLASKKAEEVREMFAAVEHLITL